MLCRLKTMSLEFDIFSESNALAYHLLNPFFVIISVSLYLIALQVGVIFSKCGFQTLQFSRQSSVAVS